MLLQQTEGVNQDLSHSRSALEHWESFRCSPKSFKIGYTTKIDFTYAKAYERWVYFDQLTSDRGNPVVEWNPAYQAAATWPQVLPSTPRIVRTKMKSQDSVSGIMNWRLWKGGGILEWMLLKNQFIRNIWISQERTFANFGCDNAQVPNFVIFLCRLFGCSVFGRRPSWNMMLAVT